MEHLVEHFTGGKDRKGKKRGVEWHELLTPGDGAAPQGTNQAVQRAGQYPSRGAEKNDIDEYECVRDRKLGSEPGNRDVNAYLVAESKDFHLQ